MIGAALVRWSTIDTTPPGPVASRFVSAFRIGQGFDIHPFGAGRRLVLAGIEIPGATGLVGHSDADVALHALADALLGAIGAGDIGRHFPDTDPQHEDRPSAEFVREVMRRVRAQGYRVANADLTILAEAPRLAPHLDAMQAAVAALLGVAADAANVKATRGEGLGTIGRREGIAAQAIVLLERDGDR
jgi:2-C-methyl-D-erythritol 2,4-cyclodiphosphate synthase